jgi:hypothetical protein
MGCQFVSARHDRFLRSQRCDEDCRGGRLVENIRPWAINPWPTTKATHGAMNPATPTATGWTFVPSSQGAGQVAPGRCRADRDARPLSGLPLVADQIR